MNAHENINIDQIETSYKKGQRYFADNIAKNNIFRCSPGYVRGGCLGGHTFAAVQFCGKEYCADCSRDGSPIHQKRVNRVWKRAVKWDSMGYLVITIPDYMREFFKSKKILKDFRFKLLRKLKESYNIKEGVARWHWFGDCESCGGCGCAVCDMTGAGNYWHPHLNILFPAMGFIEDLNSFLIPLRTWMRQYLKKLIKTEIQEIEKERKGFFLLDDDEQRLNFLLDIYIKVKKEDLIINYSYVLTDKHKMNRVKYVFRATFKRYQSDIKQLLYNFRNSIQWGWKKSDKDIDSNEENEAFCPECEKIGVKHLIKWGILEKIDKENIIYKIKIKNDETKRKSSLYGVYRRAGNINKREPHSLFKI